MSYATETRSTLDEPIASLDILPNCRTYVHQLARIHRLDPNTSSLEAFARLTNLRWDLPGLDSHSVNFNRAVVEKGMAHRHLHFGMSAEELSLRRREPQNFLFRRIDCVNRAIRFFHERRFYLNKQVLDFIGQNNVTAFFSKLPPATSKDVVECAERVRASFEGSPLAQTAPEDSAPKVTPTPPTPVAPELGTASPVQSTLRFVPLAEFAFDPSFQKLIGIGRLKTLGDLVDHTPAELMTLAELGEADLRPVRVLLASHKLAVRGEEFRRFGMSADLNQRLSDAGLRHVEALLGYCQNWLIPHPAPARPNDLRLNQRDIDELFRVVAQIAVEHAQHLAACNRFLTSKTIPDDRDHAERSSASKP